MYWYQFLVLTAESWTIEINFLTSCFYRFSILDRERELYNLGIWFWVLLIIFLNLKCTFQLFIMSIEWSKKQKQKQHWIQNTEKENQGINTYFLKKTPQAIFTVLPSIQGSWKCILCCQSPTLEPLTWHCGALSGTVVTPSIPHHQPFPPLHSPCIPSSIKTGHARLIGKLDLF